MFPLLLSDILLVANAQREVRAQDIWGMVSNTEKLEQGYESAGGGYQVQFGGQGDCTTNKRLLPPTRGYMPDD